MEAVAMKTMVKVNQQTNVSSITLSIFDYLAPACAAGVKHFYCVGHSVSVSVCWQNVFMYASSKAFTDFILNVVNIIHNPMVTSIQMKAVHFTIISATSYYRFTDSISFESHFVVSTDLCYGCTINVIRH